MKTRTSVRAHLRRVRGQPRIVWLDSFGEGLPIPDTRGAWRLVIYRPPQIKPRRVSR